MLKLDRRPMQLGPSINTRTQKHGEENVTALDIPFSGLALSKDELCAVMLDPRAYKLLYKKRKNRLDQPMWGSLIKALVFRQKIAGCTIVLYVGRKQVLLSDATLSKVHLERNEGGVTHLSATIQCVPDLDENRPMMESLLARLNDKLDIQIVCEHYGAQPDLPLEEDDDSDDGDDDEEDDANAKERGRGFAESVRQRNDLASDQD